jgi:predicted RNase H-like HicB family nuclease
MSMYNVIVHTAEEGGYWAEVPDLPGCYSEADTLDELKDNIKEAISLYLEDNSASIEHSSMMQVMV